jgi:DNA ligase-1
MHLHIGSIRVSVFDRNCFASGPRATGRGKPAADILPWPGGQANPPAGGARMRYQIVAEAYRDLEAATARLELIDRLAALIAETPKTLLPTVTLLCQGEIAPDFAGVELGLAERMAARAVAEAAGVTAEQALASAKEVGDLGLAAEALLAALAPRPATLEVEVVFGTLHQIAQAEGTGSQARKLAPFVGLLREATPLEARYLVRIVTGSLRLGIGTATILDALAEVHAGGRKARPVLERAYNICSDLGLVAATLVQEGLEAVEGMRVRAGNPVRPMLAQRMSSSAEILAKLGGRARPSTSTTASACRPTAPPTGSWSCSPAAWSASPASSPTR